MHVPRDVLRAAALWNAHASEPQLHRFKDLCRQLGDLGVPGMNLEQQLRALGIRWAQRDGASWQRRGQKYKVRPNVSPDTTATQGGDQ